MTAGEKKSSWTFLYGWRSLWTEFSITTGLPVAEPLAPSIGPVSQASSRGPNDLLLSRAELDIYRKLGNLEARCIVGSFQMLEPVGEELIKLATLLPQLEIGRMVNITIRFLAVSEKLGLCANDSALKGFLEIAAETNVRTHRAKRTLRLSQCLGNTPTRLRYLVLLIYTGQVQACGDAVRRQYGPGQMWDTIVGALFEFPFLASLVPSLDYARYRSWSVTAGNDLTAAVRGLGYERINLGGPCQAEESQEASGHARWFE